MKSKEKPKVAATLPGAVVVSMVEDNNLSPNASTMVTKSRKNRRFPAAVTPGAVAVSNDDDDDDDDDDAVDDDAPTTNDPASSNISQVKLSPARPLPYRSN
jgi:hypothetical protein